jgi:hypothetical protein
MRKEGIPDAIASKALNRWYRAGVRGAPMTPEQKGTRKALTAPTAGNNVRAIFSGMYGT